jgi:hypothetical protein
MRLSVSMGYTIQVRFTFLDNPTQNDQNILAGTWAKTVGIDSLALIACLLFPRYVSCTRALKGLLDRQSITL